MNVVDARTTVSREATTTDRMSHIVQDRDKVRRALLEGLPVRALCGKVWVPKRWKPADTVRCCVCDDLARRVYPVGP